MPYYIDRTSRRLQTKSTHRAEQRGACLSTIMARCATIPTCASCIRIPEVWINPDSAGPLGIEDGDWVHVSSRAGDHHRSGEGDACVNPREVYRERFWNRSFWRTAGDISQSWKAMNVNMLSNGESRYDRVFGSYTLRGYTVKIEKTDAPPEGVWYRPEDFQPWMPQPSDETEMVFA